MPNNPHNLTFPYPLIGDNARAYNIATDTWRNLAGAGIASHFAWRFKDHIYQLSGAEGFTGWMPVFRVYRI
jgi:hypothetical protein